MSASTVATNEVTVPFLKEPASMCTGRTASQVRGKTFCGAETRRWSLHLIPTAEVPGYQHGATSC